MSQSNAPIFVMRLIGADDNLANDARALITKSFSTRLGAYPNTDHKHFLVVEVKIGNTSKLVACSSLSFAGEQPLFSEKYLPGTIEDVIEENIGLSKSRSSVCEIGSLSTDPDFVPAVKSIVAYFPWFAYRLGCEFGLVTVTSYMREALANAGVYFQPICAADPKNLTLEERARWGRYYNFKPQTGILNLKSLEFLNQIASHHSTPHEAEIKLGCFRKIDACL